MPDSAALRDRLTRLRDDALRRLALLDAVDPGLMRLIADAGAVLAALDAADDPPPG